MAAFLGNRIRSFFHKNKPTKEAAEKKHPALLKLWNKYGVIGLGFLDTVSVGAPISIAVGVGLNANIKKLITWCCIGVLTRCIAFTLEGYYGLQLSKPNLSDGPTALPTSSAPLSLIPSEIYLLRYVSIDGDWSADAEKILAKSITLGATVRLGPLIVSSPDLNGIMIPYFRSPTSLFVQPPQVLAVSATFLPTLPSFSPPDIIFDIPLPSFPLP